MQIYAGMDQRLSLAGVSDHARRVEAIGYDGLNVPDAVHDGLLAAQAALSATARLKVATSVLVCFPRSPMNVAHAAWDLQATSGGRFELGLGSQVRGNIIDRYSTPWTAPVPRMREYVQSLRAIWSCWQDGGELAFEGAHYRFTRMQPFFNPGPIAHPAIPIFLGAVGPKMTELVGEVADGIMTHPTNGSPRHLREATLPELAAGAARAGRATDTASVMAAGFVATGPTASEVALQRGRIRELLAFLYSTPTYWRSLDVHGWRDVGERLHELSRQGRWPEMAGAVGDEMLEALVPQGPYDVIAATLKAWYDGLADCITFPLPDDRRDDAKVAAVVAQLRERRVEHPRPKAP
ncbi:MAG: TIGR03617 family F420-dependent LLM class oxidoreductase [Myxococcota bacterium]